MSFSEFTQKDYEVIARSYAELKEAARKRCSGENELEVVQKAFEFANEAHKNVRRRSGEPYILHPVAVAKIVVNDIGLGYKSISAALLHDVVEDTAYTTDDIRNLFGEKIASLVEGLTKIKNVLDNQDKKNKNDDYTESLQAENFKRILLTLNDDVRVVLIKLADRLHNCRTIEYMPEYKRDKILSETMFIFVPLAHRLGLYEVKSEMENIWLRYKEPDAYNDISAKINRDISDKERSIDEFIAPIETALREAGFNFRIKKRVKTPYSIWHKMATKQIPFEQVYDLYAVRIIFTPAPESNESERDQCYHVFSIITGLYRYKSDRVRDWVKHPKSNGYEALHCTLMSMNGLWIEVQIRSRRMDDIAEKGIAAHWAYKQDGYIGENDSEMDKWLSKVKEILVSPDVNALELLDIIHNDLISTSIMVFTPKGEQKSIQKGATALDFAYMIHTEIGHKAIAAKINMKLVPLSSQLKTGDQVEIITAEDQQPKKEWLDFLQTRHAKSLVMDWFRTDKAKYIKAGREELTEKLKSMGIRFEESIARNLAAALEVKNTDELLFRFGIGYIRYETIAELVDRRGESVFWHFPWKNRDNGTEKSSGKGGNFIINDPGDGHKYIFASCCHPIPGDPTVGFLSPDGTITVHKKTCGVAENIASKHGDWIVRLKWNTTVGASFPVRIMLKGIDRVGLLNEITRYISLVMGVNMRRLNLNTEDGIFEGYIDMLVHDREVLDSMIEKLKGIKGIQDVMRSGI
ncbi:MAG: RelA/SpoT family protein [Bacteroidales bacterium]|nr:RelA/SpoT family protein [Bacteroidales bacterium]